ncbi:MAG: TlpA family protein disulfide reductase [Bryobacteraceae bacterium]
MERLLRGSIGLLLAVFTWVIYDSFHEKLVVVGDDAPDFNITTDSGRKVTARNFGGKLLVLNFWATWCPPCVDEMPSLDAFQRLLAGKGVVVLGISVDKDENEYRKFLQAARVSFLTARDPTNTINLEYGTVKYPETYIIDGAGVVRRKIINSRNWMDPSIVRDVESLL